MLNKFSLDYFKRECYKLGLYDGNSKISKKECLLKLSKYYSNLLGGYTYKTWGYGNRLRYFYPSLTLSIHDVSHEKITEMLYSKDWIIEPCYNGYRVMITYTPEEGFNFYSYRDFDINFFVPKVISSRILIKQFTSFTHPNSFLGTFKDSFVLDGMIVSNFDKIESGTYFDYDTKLAQLLKRGYLIRFFDVLRFNNKNISKLPLRKRLDYQKSIGEMISSMNIDIKPTSIKNENKLNAINSALEKYTSNTNLLFDGIIFKNLNSPYNLDFTRNSKHWVKYKFSGTKLLGSPHYGKITGYIKSSGRFLDKMIIGGLKISFLVNGKWIEMANTSDISDDDLKMMTIINREDEPVLNDEFNGRNVSCYLYGYDKTLNTFKICRINRIYKSAISDDRCELNNLFLI